MPKLPSFRSFGVLKEVMFAPICHVGGLAKHQWGAGDLECDTRGPIPAPALPSAPNTAGGAEGSGNVCTLIADS